VVTVIILHVPLLLFHTLSFPPRRSSDLVYDAPVPVLCLDHKGAAPLPAAGEARTAALKDFVFGRCQAEANWNMENFIADQVELLDRKSTRLNSSHVSISYAVFCLKKKHE